MVVRYVHPLPHQADLWKLKVLVEKRLLDTRFKSFHNAFSKIRNFTLLLIPKTHCYIVQASKQLIFQALG